MNGQEFIERRTNSKNNWFYSMLQKTIINKLIYELHFFLLIYSQLDFILDIRLIRYIDLMDSVIKHVLNVGLGKIHTNRKGNNLKPIVINNKTYRHNKDKPLTKTFKHII